MPLYDFFCENCGEFEQLVNSNADGESMHCPMCGNPNAKRIFSPPTYCGVFSGVRHTLRRRAEKGSEPRVVRKAVGEPLEGTLPMPHKHGHDHSHGAGELGYPPWMIKH